MLKRTIYLSVFLIAILGLNAKQSHAQIKQQRIGYVHPRAILQKMPEWKAVQQRLQNFASQKQKDMKEKQQSFQKQVQSYRQKQSSMSQAAQQKEEKRLGKLQANLQKVQRQAQQAIQKKQQDLVGPLYKDISNSIQNVARQKNLSYVINTQVNSGDQVILYASDTAKKQLDITSAVMEDLGITGNGGESSNQ